MCAYCNHLKSNYLPHVFLLKLESSIELGIGAKAYSLDQTKTIHKNLKRILEERNIRFDADNKYKISPFPENKSSLPESGLYVRQSKKKRKCVSPVSRLVGHLNKPLIVKNYIPAEEGHPVYYVDEDRYAVYLTKQKPITHTIHQIVEIRYYKTTLNGYINFKQT